ncbi:hypothetical protein TNCV_2445341 [Trichonephila clavipes]|nr:hypothetical protein TNCV_2445341 [Trichonephila clavipes]
MPIYVYFLHYQCNGYWLPTSATHDGIFDIGCYTLNLIFERTFDLDIRRSVPLVCSLAEIVEVEIEVVSPSIVPSGSFSELKSHCHLYGAQGQRQAYLLPMPR